MPDRPSDEDSFADLFGKLPDPRAREAVAATDGADEIASHNDGIPLSRREAREAAAREATTATTVEALPRRVERSEPNPRETVPAAVQAESLERRADPQHTRHRSHRSAPATLEDLFTGEASTEALGSTPPPVDKRKRRLGGWIVLGLVLVLLGGVVGGGAWAWNTYEDRVRSFMGWEEPKDYDAGIAEGEVTVTISSGDTGESVSTLLYQAGVTKTSGVFYDMLVASGQNPTFYPGLFKLQTKMTAADALTALENPANRLENTVVIPEGMAYKQALQRVADATGLSYDDLLTEADNYTQFGVPAEAPSIEGFLFPATYTFDTDVTAHDAIARLVDEMFSRLDALGVAKSDRLSVLSLAAVIQKESGPDVADMAKISRVFLNRVAQGMALESDATVAYGAGSTGTVWTTEDQRADESNIYNTYVHTGLPAGPIGLPGEDAIDAALHPADGAWLYFVAVNLKTGETTFSNSYDEHLVAVKQLQDWCAESEDNAAYCQ